MDKKVIERNLKSGIFKTVEKPPTSKSSAIWTKFRLIIDDKDVMIDNFIACFKCKSVYKFESRKTGTSNILKHKCPSSSTLEKFLKPTEIHSLTVELKKKVLRSCCEFVIKDLRPMEAIAGEGLKSLLLQFVEVGSQLKVSSSNFDISAALPHPVTVSRNIKQIAAEIKINLKDLVLEASQIGGGVTTDLWTDDHKRINYIGITFHYIKGNKLFNRCLCVRQLSEERKTGEYLKNEILTTLRIYKMVENVNKIVFVTDRGANIKSALHSFVRLNCFAHFLNNVIQKCLDDTSEGKINKILIVCRKLVRYFKKASLQNLLQISLKHDVSTRWNSVLVMLQSITTSWDTVNEVLGERNELNRIEDLDKTDLEVLICFLKPFKNATDEIEGSNYPTLYLVVLLKIKITEHLNIINSDEVWIRNAKTRGLQYMTNLNLEMEHYAAVFLHPLLKQLNMVDEVTKHDTINWVKEKVLTCTNVVEEVPSSTGPFSQKEKRPRIESTLFEFVFPEEENLAPPNEIDAYKEAKIWSSADFNLLSWWQDHKTKFPRLYIIAQRIHAIPASSAPSERLFSISGNVITDKRNSIDPDLVDDILVAKSNWDVL